MNDQELLKKIHNSLAIRFGTSVPYSIGSVRCEKIGFADIPAIRVDVVSHALDPLVPLVRQRVYAELAERGWTPDDIQFRPTVGLGRKRKFVDQNESSESYGKNKVGTVYEFSFEMERELARATFAGGGRYKPLPTKEES